MDSSRKPASRNPREDAATWSQLLFAWLVPMLWRGSRNGITADQLTQCMPNDDSAMLGDQLECAWNEELAKANRKQHPPRLRRALFTVFAPSTVLNGFAILQFTLIKTLMPVVLAQLLKQFQPPIESHNIVGTVNSSTSSTAFNHSASVVPSHETPHSDQPITDHTHPIYANLLARSDAWLAYAWTDMLWLGIALVTLNCLGFLIKHHVNLRNQLLGGRMRIACCSLIYRKTLRLSKRAADRTAAGYLLNLLSNDVCRLDMGLVFAHYVWILPLQLALVTWLIWQQVGGWPAMVGVSGLLVLCIPVQTALSKLLAKLRSEVAQRTDKRLGILSEIISGIRVIKMYAWERPFGAVVAETREREMRQVRLASYIRAFYIGTDNCINIATLFVTLGTCVLMGQRISADLVYSMASFFNALQLTAAIYYPYALEMGAEALVSVERVEEFLLQEEQLGSGENVAEEEEKTLVDARSVRCSKRKLPGTPSNAIELSAVSASWERTITNPVAPAASTLIDISLSVPTGSLCAIIGPIGAGKSSLLHLLTGELPPNGGGCVAMAEDATLSYASQEPWLFDGTVRQNILFGLTYDQRRYHEVVQCCALTTDFKQLPHGDRTLVGERGTALSGGQRARINLARAVYKEANVYLLDDPLSAVDANVGKHLFDQLIGPSGRLAKLRRTRLLVTHQVHMLKQVDWIVVLDGGRVVRQGTWEELTTSELDYVLCNNDEDEQKEEQIEAELVSDSEHEIVGDSAIRKSKKQHSSISLHTLRSKASLATSAEDIGADSDKDRNAEEQAKGSVSLSVWRKYFRAGGSVCALIVLFVTLVFSQVVKSGSDYALNYWMQQEDLRLEGVTTVLSQQEYLYIYAGFVLAFVVFGFVRGYMIFDVCLSASKELHDRMFGRMLLSPMRFFDTNPSGRIMNRFSKDIGTIDETLPKMMMDSISIGLVMLGVLVMVSLLNPLMIGVLCVAVAAFAGILKLYLRPTQDLKRLEGITRSPVFSHLSASLAGISTIRTCGLQQRLITEFDALQNVQSGVWQLVVSANYALAMWLDFVSGVYVAAVTFTFIGLYDYSSSGDVGLAITQSLMLTGMVAFGVSQTANLLQQMTSVERVMQYTDLEPETQPDNKPPPNWPSAGLVQFRNMYLRYSPHDPPTLADLTLDIAAGWKVGIVGRTGAGKSSLIAALFRLAPINGRILIDGIDTGTITLDSLRSAIAIIPQDPVLFSATVRNNLDPFGRYSDDQLWQALAAVELRSAIQSLDFMVTEAGTNFSVGQRQLICLARAILRGNRVLVLDEATANVDPQTDALIQRTIRERFAECTVLTVAHRLHTVMDSDRIVVMDAGRVSEFDWPAKLLAQEGGVLRDMVEATGPQEAANLRAIAEETMGAKSCEATMS